MRPVDRSMNEDLNCGMTDGKLKKSTPNRGGIPEHTSESHRSTLSADYDLISELEVGTERPDMAGHLPY